LSNADLKETIDLLRTVVDARRIAPITGTNALTLKDTPERVEAAAKVISAIDKARPEVVIDVQLLEVDRSKLKEYGLQIASPGSPGIDGAADINRDGFTLRDLRTLSDGDVFLTGLPAIYYRLLKQDTNTRTLANPQLRTMEGITTAARWGERVPVPQTTFAPIATGGVAQQPIVSYAYENIGVNLDITPRLHHDDEVSLSLKVEVSSVSGEGFGGLQVNLSVQALDADVMKAYVAAGLGISIIPDFIYTADQDPGLRTREIDHLFPPVVSAVLLRRRTFLRQYVYIFLEQLNSQLGRERVEGLIFEEK